MSFPTSALVAVLLPAALGQVEPPLSEPVKQELQRLQGGWQVAHDEENGKAASAAELKQRTLFIGHDSFLLRDGGKLLKIGMLKNIDLERTPHAATVIMVQGGKKGKIMLGIFERDGDDFKLCIDTTGDSRPKDFSAGTDSNRRLFVCKRIPRKQEEHDLSGLYRSESTEIDGSKHTADAVIERLGDAYKVTYIKNSAVVFIGVGIRKGDTFCMSWVSGGQAGITLYDIEKNHRLVGQYTRLGGPGILTQEILTRKDFN
jgi:uncharacterized protein (TIGR03067 family)